MTLGLRSLYLLLEGLGEDSDKIKLNFPHCPLASASSLTCPQPLHYYTDSRLRGHSTLTN